MFSKTSTPSETEIDTDSKLFCHEAEFVHRMVCMSLVTFCHAGSRKKAEEVFKSKLENKKGHIYSSEKMVPRAHENIGSYGMVRAG